MSDGRHPLLELTRVRLLEFFREPEAIFWIFVFPVLMTLTLGIAFRSPADARIPVAVLAGGDRVAQALERDGGFRTTVMTDDRARAALRDGEVHLVVAAGPPPRFVFDPTRPESRVARLAVDAALQRDAGRVDVWTADEERVVAPGSRYVDWLVPGLLGMNVMGTSLWGIGFSIVNARMQKLLQRFMATPMRRWHYLVAQVLARMTFLALEVAILIGFAHVVFGVPVRGSAAGLATVCVVGALSFAGLGLLVASRARTIEAVSGLLNVVMLPMWVGSGVFFSSKNFPAFAQPFLDALPLTALNQSLRGLMLEGLPLAGVAPQLLILAAWGALAFLLALRLFRWR
ncbi:MAG: ABC transporter permease [Vicinamibacterales bacterium]